MARPPRPDSGCLFIVAALLACAHHLHAQAPAAVPTEYTLREWHEYDGLPSEELTGLAQDAAGFLWISTNTALVRFDGHTFEACALPAGGHPRVLTTIKGTDDPTRRIPAIAASPARADAEGGLFVVRERTLVFSPEPQLAGRSTRAIFTAPDGALWLGGEDGTVLRRIGEQVHRVEPLEDPNVRRPPGFASDAWGAVWVLRGNRLLRFEAATAREIESVRTEPELRIASSARGGIWLFTRSALHRWSGVAFEEVMRLPDLLGAHFVQSVLEDSHGFLWIGTRSQGLFRVVGRELTPVPTSGENIVALCEDSEGNIWAATDGAGLSRLRARAHRLLDQSSGLRDPFSYTVTEDATGAIWLANRDGGMARVVDGVVDPVSRRAGWRQFSAMSVQAAADGTVWMTTGLGVFRTSSVTPEVLERVPALGSMRGVRSTFVARNGDYWLAAEPDRLVRHRDGVLTTFGPGEGYDGRDARAFAEDEAGRIWVGASEGRLFRIDGDRLERIELRITENPGALQAIRFEPDGTMLIGSTRYGVIIVPQGDPARTRTLFSDHGLPWNNITQILVDDCDRHWFASRGGVFWVHSRDVREFSAGRVSRVHAIRLGRDDGLPYLTCLGLYQPAAWKARDGTLWFATRRGVLRTDPALMAPASTTPPPVSISAIFCDGQEQPLLPTLEVSAQVKRIQIRLTALNLSAPESVQVRFRLDGFDSDWVVQDHERTATYPRLPPGRYVFSTMASNGTGTWSSQPAQLTLVVNPQWWQRPWTQAAGVLVLIAVVAALVRAWSHRRLRLRLERAEQARAIEQERARIARNIHDDVGASLTRISLLTQAALDENTAHSPTLEKIYEATHAITRSMDEIVWAVNPRHDNTESLVYYIGNFAQNLLGAAGIRCRLESPTQLPDAPLTSQIRHHLFLACKEALHNIVKHSGAAEAAIHITLADGRLQIHITDDGRGIGGPATPDAAPRSPSRPGDGLRNMQQRMAEIHGTCSIAPTPGGGTTVAFSVPLPAATAGLNDPQ